MEKHVTVVCVNNQTYLLNLCNIPWKHHRRRRQDFNNPLFSATGIIIYRKIQDGLIILFIFWNFTSRTDFLLS